MDPIAFFFIEGWAHRRNRFIAVGGLALFFLLLTVVLIKIPWMPDAAKASAAFFGAFAVATIFLMLYYAGKSVLVGCTILCGKIFRSDRRGQ